MAIFAKRLSKPPFPKCPIKSGSLETPWTKKQNLQNVMQGKV